ncbi:MAG: lysine--tRNA ligase [Candidatus Yanofskybacteria bacterium CG10_big_fil_rev_8_21_14_0_10_46_23]|uniref:Lysine--tRNA ligase n=1 Tax=Candidatus Yanofskybacteria bacterium CG10_big_fil_rev_8_21_14_0_10_46_23 TaxID=1975098 RepID=A0A2H0R4J1_9BACT|nr:MAG: lysine--tRNA ligase [Candidatus Yanofskybacteria bacterium CG10_big_fil_rev_8_21_14_0_10_46_23]
MALEEIRKIKINKVERLRKNGAEPYPALVERTHTIAEAKDDFENLQNSGETITIVGRVVSRREHGGSIFINLIDGGGEFQTYLKKDIVGEAVFQSFIDFADVGDFLEVSGKPFTTKKGEPTLEINSLRIISKAILPMPEKWHGLKDVEERFRKRYLDLIFNKDVRTSFELRTKIIVAVRNYFIDHGFMEVETPILQPLAGGALARPFKTHMNDLDLDLYLRVAPELYLKRLLVGGFERVFEIGKDFRNEGMDREHNPEFTMLEAYAAYRDYNWMMDFIESLFRKVVKEVFDTEKIETEKGEINFGQPFPRRTFNDLLKEHAGVDYDEISEADLKIKAADLGIKVEDKMSKGLVADEIYKKVARPGIIQPTFIINHPLDISPLAKKMPTNPSHVERFQLLLGAMEVANAFSELNDPIDQRERFATQEKNRDRGDEEAHRMDNDFIEALEYGMPPAAGVGIGIDRLVTLLTGAHTLREIILFPTMKPVKIEE